MKQPSISSIEFFKYPINIKIDIKNLNIKNIETVWKLKPLAPKNNSMGIKKKWYLNFGCLKIQRLRQKAIKTKNYAWLRSFWGLFKLDINWMFLILANIFFLTTQILWKQFFLFILIKLLILIKFYQPTWFGLHQLQNHFFFGYKILTWLL